VVAAERQSNSGSRWAHRRRVFLVTSPPDVSLVDGRRAGNRRRPPPQQYAESEPVRCRTRDGLETIVLSDLAPVRTPSSSGGPVT